MPPGVLHKRNIFYDEAMNQESAPLISIIVAVYNCKATLQQCIDSVAQQTYPNKELIIIDGGSKDGTVELLEKNRSKFSYWVSEPDRGIYNAWNKGLEQTHGEWICFLGADDYFWDATVLERMVVQLEKLPKKIRVAYGKIMLISDDGQSPPRPIGESWELVKASFKFKSYMNIPHVGTMHRRSLFEQHGKFDESFRIAGDYELLLRELKTGDAVFISDIITAGQRLGGISTDAGNYLRALQEVWRAQRMHGQLLPGKFFLKEVGREYLRLLLLNVLGKRLKGMLFDLRFRYTPMLYKLLGIFWSLKDYANRKKFKLMFSVMLREYMADAKLGKLLPAESESPYKGEYSHSEINPKILLVVHEFSRTGAPYAVLYLARALYSIHGVRPAVISSQDGPLRAEFEHEGFRTIVDPLLFSYRNYSSEACDYVAKFERVIVTSLASFGFIRYFRGIGKRLTWWIHETGSGFNAVVNMNADLPLLFAACESIWLGSPLCLPLALQFTSQDKLHLLLYGCPDTVLPHRPHESGRIVFSIIGSFDQRKGQDIFVEAVGRLPRELRVKAVFRIIGSPAPSVSFADYYKTVRTKGDLIPEIEFINTVPAGELQELYAATDVFVSASRDDPMPIVITQGLMYSKLCLCSSAIGQARLLEDGKDGLIFANDSAEALSVKMAWILRNPNELTALGMAGRIIYEKYFLMSSFTTNVELLMEEALINCSV